MNDTPKTPDTQVEARPKRRSFTAEFKLRILEEAEQCSSPSDVGAILRREGLYSSHLHSWRQARREGTLNQLSKKRGRKPKRTPHQKEAEKLARENARLRAKLEQAELIIEVQKKISELMAIKFPPSDNDDEQSS